MLRFVSVLTAIGWLVSTSVRAQPGSLQQREINLNTYLQELFPVQIEGIDYQSVYDGLTQLYANPLNLNTASRDELAATYLLSERQLSSLIEYRTLYGDLLAVQELQAVPAFDLPTIRRLLPFVTVATGKGVFGGLPTPTDNFFILRYEQVLEQQKGFSPAIPDKKGQLPTRYVGNSQQWYARYRYSRPGAFSVGLTAEKDPGEGSGLATNQTPIRG